MVAEYREARFSFVGAVLRAITCSTNAEIRSVPSSNWTEFWDIYTWSNNPPIRLSTVSACIVCDERERTAGWVMQRGQVKAFRMSPCRARRDNSSSRVTVQWNNVGPDFQFVEVVCPLLHHLAPLE